MRLFLALLVFVAVAVYLLGMAFDLIARSASIP